MSFCENLLGLVNFLAVVCMFGCGAWLLVALAVQTLQSKPGVVVEWSKFEKQSKPGAVVEWSKFETEVYKMDEKSVNVYKVVVIDREKGEIISEETVLAEDERGAWFKTGLSLSAKLKGVLLNNLAYVITKLGSYQKK